MYPVYAAGEHPEDPFEGRYYISESRIPDSLHKVHTLVCHDCGAVVGAIASHDKFHEGLLEVFATIRDNFARVKEVLTDLGRKVPRRIGGGGIVARGWGEIPEALDVSKGTPEWKRADHDCSPRDALDMD